MISRRDFLPLAAGFGWNALGLTRLSGANLAEMPIFRAATSAALLSDVNVNDARMAMHSWADFLSATLGMRVDYDQFYACAPSRLIDLMREGAVHAIGCTTPEYMTVAPYVEPNTLLMDKQNGLQEYVILVHAEAKFQSLADLRRQPLVMYHHETTCVALDWLDTTLHAAGLELSERFFSAIVPNPRLPRTVLPVYFRQADACLAPKRGFETMCELNPQLGKSLRALAVSPPLYTAIFGFHKDCPPAINLRCRTALIQLAKTASGQQMLALFQVSEFATASVSLLGNTLKLLEAVRQIRRRAGA